MGDAGTDLSISSQHMIESVAILGLPAPNVRVDARFWASHQGKDEHNYIPTDYDMSRDKIPGSGGVMFLVWGACSLRGIQMPGIPRAFAVVRGRGFSQDLGRKEAWLSFRTNSGVRLCWELEEPKLPNGWHWNRPTQGGECLRVWG